jgi:hypothetical protein
MRTLIYYFEIITLFLSIDTFVEEYLDAEEESIEQLFQEVGIPFRGPTQVTDHIVKLMETKRECPGIFFH